jgi:hypothetical protein
LIPPLYRFVPSTESYYKIPEAFYKIAEAIYNIPEIFCNMTEAFYKIAKAIYNISETFCNIADILIKIPEFINIVSEGFDKNPEGIIKMPEGNKNKKCMWDQLPPCTSNQPKTILFLLLFGIHTNKRVKWTKTNQACENKYPGKNQKYYTQNPRNNIRKK